MRYLFLLFFLPQLAQSQSSQSFRIDSISMKGVLLNQKWKWHNGDDPNWSKSDFNDSDWSSLDPTVDLVDSLPHLLNSGISWLRLHLGIDSNVLSHSLAMIIQQSVASEFFLNGRLIHRFGIISQISNKIKAHDPQWLPVSLPVTKDTQQVLAIRLTTKPNIKYTKIFETYNPLVSVTIMKTEEAVNYYNNIRVITERFFLFIIGIALVIFIVQISFFLGYPARKQSLYFALFAITYLIGDIIQLNFFILEHDLALKYLLGNLAFILFTAAEFFTLLAVYTLFERKKDFLFWLVAIFYLPSVWLNISIYGIGWQLGGANFEILVHLAVIRAGILASVQKKRNAWIIAFGAIASIVFFALFLAKGTFYNNNFVYSLTYLRCAYYILFIMSIPIATSIYMGLDYAIVNNSLKQKLTEVQDLSQKSLAQEQEKQAILASQNETLETQVNERTHTLSKTLIDLQSTQAQLIQSEKMASLGELTAGIAHEIQNPLNFVNNFSEVNTELIKELEEEARSEHRDTKNEAELLLSIKKNSEKINHHGKRAESIVKGMLEHSRKSTGVKEPTDINKLCDEFVRLSYHGLRAKNKSFNCDYKLDLDPKLPMVNAVSQDIGRVILNIVNNAFQSVHEQQLKQNDFKPMVTVTTKRINDTSVGPSHLPNGASAHAGQCVSITISDNGPGIPDQIKDKIFQPFFTTKPTGQGTGLGLSLAYDIVKAHKGTIAVDSSESNGTLFTIQIPK